MPHTLYSAAEVADYLRVSVAEVEAWARRAEIPCDRRGGRFVFRRGEVELWASCCLLDVKERRLRDYHERSSRAQGACPRPIVPALLSPDRIAIALTSRTRASVIRDMVELAEGTGLLNYPADLLKQIESREAEHPTALAGGVALLHPGHREPYLFEDSFLLLGRTIQAIPFGAPDAEATDLFFLLCCRDDRLHLHALSRLCLLCYHTPLPDALRRAATAEEAFQALVRAEDSVLAGLSSKDLK